MADITVTAANVLAGAKSKIRDVTWGATVTAGQAVYRDPADGNEWKPADGDAVASAGVEGDDESVGISLTGGADGQPGKVCVLGDINPGGTVTVGQVYVISLTAGGIAVYGDLGSGDFVTILGVGETTSNIKLKPNVSGVAKP